MNQSVNRATFVLALVWAVGCCSNNGKPYVPDTRAQRIVFQHVQTHLDVDMDPFEDKAALDLFLEASKGAADRAGLIAAWKGVPALKSKAPDLLSSAFQQAEKDTNWPGGDDEAPWVQGTREAVEGFVKEGD